MTKTILIADDTPGEALMLKRVLLLEGYLVLMARNGLEAAELVKKGGVDLVISDVDMPKMDGYELCRFIKNDENFCQIPFVLCTTLSDPMNLIKGIEVGANNYITKPWDEKNLCSLVKEHLSAPSYRKPDGPVEEIFFGGQKYKIQTSQQDILNFLLSTYENIHKQNQELFFLREQVQKSCDQLACTQKEQEQILLNIFPEKIAQELMAYGSVEPKRYDEVSVMFIDFVGFSKSSLDTNPQDLIAALSFYFENFDRIIGKRQLERIKTIGDGYMCAGGIPNVNSTHALDCVMAALDIQQFVSYSAEEIQKKYNLSWQARIGIHTGAVVSGVVGKKRLAYDIWGETVNLASRIESYSEMGEINISQVVYEKVKDYVFCQPRGKIDIHNKEGVQELSLDMYFVIGTKPIH